MQNRFEKIIYTYEYKNIFITTVSPGPKALEQPGRRPGCVRAEALGKQLYYKTPPSKKWTSIFLKFINLIKNAR